MLDDVLPKFAQILRACLHFIFSHRFLVCNSWISAHISSLDISDIFMFIFRQNSFFEGLVLFRGGIKCIKTTWREWSSSAAGSAAWTASPASTSLSTVTTSIRLNPETRSLSDLRQDSWAGSPSHHNLPCNRDNSNMFIFMLLRWILTRKPASLRHRHIFMFGEGALRFVDMFARSNNLFHE